MTKQTKRLVLAILSTGASIATMVLFSQQTILLTIIIFIFAFFSIVSDFSRGRLLFGISMFLIGAWAELTATHFGVWYYTAPDIWGIPLWVPCIWVIFSFSIVEIHALAMRIASRKI